MSASFITHLFACPDMPPLSNAVTASGAPIPSPKLANFVAYALHRTRLPPSVTFAALYLLQRLKVRFPAARGSSGHRLFISAFMIASKVICDDTYSNKSWCIVGQGMFSLREVNQMEREMCGYLDWQLNVPHVELEQFTSKVQNEFGTGAQAAAASLVTAAGSTPFPIIPTTTSSTPPTTISASSKSKSNVVIPVPTYHTRGGHKSNTPIPYSNEASPDGLESPSNSDTTSPASSSPATPASNADDTAHVVVSGSNIHSIPKSMATGGAMEKSMAAMDPSSSSNYAFAAPAVW